MTDRLEMGKKVTLLGPYLLIIFCSKMSRAEFLIRGPFSLFVLLHLSANGKTQTEQEGSSEQRCHFLLSFTREESLEQKRPKCDDDAPTSYSRKVWEWHIKSVE